MRSRPTALSAAAASLCAALVGLVLVAPTGASADDAPRWSAATSTAVDASAVEDRKAALRAAAPARSSAFRSPTGDPALKACYGVERTSGADGTPVDAATYGAYHGCLADGAWLLHVRTHTDFARPDLRSVTFVADTDGSPSTGCGGYEREVFGFWSAEHQEFLAGVFATPDCTTGDLTALADLQAPTSREIGLQFRHADLGGGSAVRWYGELRAHADTASESLPPTGAHVETGFADDGTPAPAPTGADGCPTASGSWYAATSEPGAVRELREAGLDDVRRVRGGLVAFSGDRSDAERVLDGAVVRRDVPYRLHAVPDDPGLGDQWALPAVRAAQAWDLGRGSRDVVVAVIDSGVDATHPDLQGQLLPGYDAAAGRPLAAGNSDPEGHGTATAGVVAAATDNATGLSSLGWGTRVLPIKVDGPDGSILGSSVIDALRYAADAGASVINLSLGSCRYSEEQLAAVRYAQSKGALVVASAGNEAEVGNPVEYPAAYPGVLAVGATGRDGSRAFYSNTGSYVDMVAPGGSADQGPAGDILVLRSGGGTTTGAGTSFSAPLVAAAAALVKAARRDLSGTALGTALTSTARDAGSPGRDDAYGTGVLDAAAALRSVVPAPPTPAVPALTVSPRTPVAGQPVRVGVRTSPGALVELYAYSRPSTTYQRVRRTLADSTGVAVFSVSPTTSSRLYATATGPSGRAVPSGSLPLPVSARVSTPAVTRTGTLAYRFTGSIQPGRPGVPVTLHSRAADGSLTRLAVGRTGSGGRWAITRSFSRAATVTVVARTTADATNAAGTSALRRVAVR